MTDEPSEEFTIEEDRRNAEIVKDFAEGAAASGEGRSVQFTLKGPLRSGGRRAAESRGASLYGRIEVWIPSLSAVTTN